MMVESGKLLLINFYRYYSNQYTPKKNYFNVMSKDSTPKEDLHQLLDKAFDENVSLNDNYAIADNKTDVSRENLHELIADTQMQKASDKIKPKATSSALRSPDKLDALVERSNQQKNDDQQLEELVSYNEKLDPSSFRSRKNLFIFRFMAIAVLTAVFTMLAIEHLVDDLSHIVQQKLGPSQVLEQMDKELIDYHQQNGRLPKELNILISFPANMLEWPYQYRQLSNLEGKPEILIQLRNAGDYVLYYRAAGRVLMKARAKPVREIQVIP